MNKLPSLLRRRWAWKASGRISSKGDCPRSHPPGRREGRWAPMKFTASAGSAFSTQIDGCQSTERSQDFTRLVHCPEAPSVSIRMDAGIQPLDNRNGRAARRLMALVSHRAPHNLHGPSCGIKSRVYPSSLIYSVYRHDRGLRSRTAVRRVVSIPVIMSDLPQVQEVHRVELISLFSLCVAGAFRARLQCGSPAQNPSPLSVSFWQRHRWGYSLTSDAFPILGRT